MKRGVFYLLFGIMSVGLVLTSLKPNQELDFNAIWSRGYIDGYCYKQEGHCIEPIVPIAPLPRIKDTTYSIIHHRGFLTGLRAYIKTQ